MLKREKQFNPHHDATTQAENPATIKRLGTDCSPDIKLQRILSATDPCDVKERIEHISGGLLPEVSGWIFQDPEYVRWRDDEQNRLLWIHGHPGKGKTMLLCSIIHRFYDGKNTTLSNKLESSGAPSSDRRQPIAYFFCQATDCDLNNATAVLRGLLYCVVRQKPCLMSYLQDPLYATNSTDFKNRNSWFVLSTVFCKILQDSAMEKSLILIDALDECIGDVELLLDLIVSHSSNSKWIVSSCGNSTIRTELAEVGQIPLKRNQGMVSDAIGLFIHTRLDEISQSHDETKDKIRECLLAHPHQPFFPAASLCRQLAKLEHYELTKGLDKFPLNLDAYYQMMINRIFSSPDASICKRILAVALCVKRPITLKELEHFEIKLKSGKGVPEIIYACGPFLTLRDKTIYFTHKSAKDFLIANQSQELFPQGSEKHHFGLFLNSLQSIKSILKQDICCLGHPGINVGEIHVDLDRLSGIEYSCMYWVDHLNAANNLADRNRAHLEDYGIIHSFLSHSILFWFEVLSIVGKLSMAHAALTNLEQILQEQGNRAMNHLAFIQDAQRFLRYFEKIIDNHPLQLYTSGLGRAGGCLEPVPTDGRGANTTQMTPMTTLRGSYPYFPSCDLITPGDTSDPLNIMLHGAGRSQNPY